ncbi:MAG: cytochrome c peroxidase [Bacteroidota bacterium]
MKKKFLIIALLVCSVCLFSFLTQQSTNPKQTIKAFCTAQFQQLSQKLATLKLAVESDKDKKNIQGSFLQARLTYKQLELILEYYFEGDVKHFNGLATNFIEEEDPAAYQEPQGFQMIESFIYPGYDKKKKNELLLYISKLESMVKGLGNNPNLFNPEEYMPDAIMEELYRIIALGISGFDSPIAKNSLPETKAALSNILFITQVYKDEWEPLQPANFNTAQKLLEGAIAYLNNHNNFDHFNRMEFITSFLNPLCDAVAGIKMKAGNKENQLHYCLIKKNGSLFKENSLDHNRYLFDDKVNEVRAALGKKLFYEPLLSVNNKRSCGGCHLPGKAFTDGLPKALQLDGHSTLPRNTPTLWNASLQMNLFYDSRHVMLEDVVMEVLGNEQEMNSGAKEAVKNLQAVPAYRHLFKQAYGEQDTAITEKNAANAIAAYIRTLISYNSRFDKYMRGEKDKMNAAEIKGFNLFMGKAKCGTCHYTPLFNGSKPPTYYYQESEVLGVPATTDTLHPVLDNDPGRMHTLKLDFFNHAFKTPTLRNIALTAPYMHNGVYKTLEEVIDFYNKGGGQGLGLKVPNQTLPADKLLLTGNEKKQLKSFLLTLTDTTGSH